MGVRRDCHSFMSVIFILVFQKLNPWNKPSSDELLEVADLTARYAMPAETPQALKETPDKKFYLSMDFNKIDNFHFHDRSYYPISAVARPDHLYLPQINHISNTLRHAPPLSQLEDLDEVRQQHVYIVLMVPRKVLSLTVGSLSLDQSYIEHITAGPCLEWRFCTR